MSAYFLFAVLQLVVSTICLYLVMRLNIGQTWTTICTGLTGLAWFGACLKIAWELFSSDFAFTMFALVAPFSNSAIGALVVLTAIFFVYRLVSGQKL